MAKADAAIKEAEDATLAAEAAAQAAELARENLAVAEKKMEDENRVKQAQADAAVKAEEELERCRSAEHAAAEKAQRIEELELDSLQHCLASSGRWSLRAHTELSWSKQIAYPSTLDSMMPSLKRQSHSGRDCVGVSSSCAKS